MSYLPEDAPDGDIDAFMAARGVVALGPLKNGEWARIPSLFRLRLVGTGTVTFDTGNSAEQIELAVKAYDLVDEPGRIDFPFFGADVTHIRATLTGSAFCEVL